MINSKAFNPSDLRIELDSDDYHFTYFTPGQHISGTATYTPTTAVKISNVSLVFNSYLYAEHKATNYGTYIGGDVYNGRSAVKTSLFRKEQRLLDGKQKLAANQKYEWRFDFEVPESVKLPFVAERQCLPPSWNILQAARTTYSLCLVVRPRYSNQTIQTTRGVHVWPFHDTALPPPVSVGYEFADPSLPAYRKLSLSRWRSNSSYDMSEPEPELRLKLRMPHQVGFWQGFPLELSCSFQGMNSEEAPDLVLDHCQLTIFADVFFSGPKGSGREVNPKSRTAPDGSLPRVCGFKLLGQGNKIPLDGSFVRIKRRMCLSDMAKPELLVPNFQIHYCLLSYVMEVSMHLIDTKSGRHFERTGKFPLYVLPGGIEPPDDAPPPAFDETDTPPAYEGDGVWLN